MQLQYEQLRSATGKAQRGMFECVQRCATKLLPEHAGHQVHFLDPPYSGVVWRVKQGRLRIFYAFNKANPVAILLFIGNRKEGDKNDAYAVLDRRVRNGDFDAQFAELGLARPNVKK
ncbi:MAG: hypothetical protein U0234_09435 [Sandaracinus sp.]